MRCANSKRCPVCGKVLVGRKDKRFCSDECRTFYHNERRYWKRHYAKYILKRTGGAVNLFKRLLQSLKTLKPSLKENPGSRKLS